MTDLVPAIVPTIAPIAAPTVAPTVAPFGGPTTSMLVASRMTRNRGTGRRNAGPKRAKPRHRNAGAPSAQKVNRDKAQDKDQPVRMPGRQLVAKVIASALGSAGSSILGGNAVKLGIPPLWAAAGLAVSGGLVAGLATHDNTREVGTGWLSAVASQLVLMSMGASKPSTVVVASAPQAPPKPKNSDLGMLPPGALDSAFERARAELAVRGDSYPEGLNPHHHTIPFVPM